MTDQAIMAVITNPICVESYGLASWGHLTNFAQGKSCCWTAASGPPPFCLP